MTFSIPSKMKPSVGGIFYDSPEWEQLPVTPILSILQFKFNSEVNLEDTSQTVFVLWRNSVEFVSSLQGFQGLHWAPVNQNTVIILIQWDSGPAWSRFQCSLGFSMVLGYLEHVTNRCVQLALPAHLSNAPFCLELVSYDFSARSDASQNVPEGRQSKFKERWNSLCQPNGINDMMYAYGDWIEDGYLIQKHYLGFGGGQREQGFKVDSHYFAGLVFWKADIDLIISSKIADQFAVLAQEANAVTTFMTEKLRYIGATASILQKAVPGAISSQPSWNYPLLNTKVFRRPDLDDSSRRECEDKIHLKAVEASITDGGKRIVPSPAGAWFPMGLINQYETLLMPEWCTPKAMLEMIYFRVLHKTSSHFKTAFEDLRDAIWKLSGWRGARQAFAPNDCCGNIKFAPAQAQQHFQQIIRDFETACVGIIQDLSYTQVPGPEPLDWQTVNLETTSFYISGHEGDNRSFKYAFDNLMKTTRMTRNYGPPISNARQNAVLFHGIGYELDLQTLKFTSAWSWKSNIPGQEVWYAEFAERAQNEYENLGHIIDWLRTLCKSSDNVTLVFDNLNKEIGPLEMADRESKQLPRPGWLFGGP
ncbi:hypothetical protein N7486_000766 [Penicillium sp. IBT 16267x]|nr:hypothetical protein N7486_000766 [Penicillium sp. IBT 16267x]